MGRRIILCDGAELARLWSRIGAGEQEEDLTWIPREDESRARPPGFRALAGGLSAEAVKKLEPKAGDEFAIVSEDGPFVRAAVAAVEKASPEAPLLVLDRLLRLFQLAGQDGSAAQGQLRIGTVRVPGSQFFHRC